ncbi:hypothetical protein GE09DRAFT_1204022 [Coniochaeta sp. 2T2.1]|nr:hypothetical protein GE09DRAFT_1204022 [Coniochaeta sp. 2T2.1]
MPAKIVTVIGAMGAQGSGVVAGLLQEPEKYHIRAVTRRPDSDAAKNLEAKGVEIVTADLNDVESLKAAFTGSQGINVAKAAAATPTLEHFIWSTLPNVTKVSGGKFAVPHFVGKNRVDAYIRQDKNLLAKTTFLWVTWYHDNFKWPMFTPYFIPTSRKYVQFTSCSPQAVMSTIGDVRKNIGPFVPAILDNPEKTQNGAIVRGEMATSTSDKLLQTWAATQGKQALSVQVPAETYYALWPMWAEEMSVMLQFWDEFAEKAWTDPDWTVLSREDLGLSSGNFVDLETSFKQLDEF